MKRFMFALAVTGLVLSGWAQVKIERIGGAAPAPVSATAPQHGPLVIGSANYLLHALATVLCRETAIEPRFYKLSVAAPWEGFEAWCREQQPPLDAVLGLGATDSRDESVARARAAHLRTIPIDASRPLDGKGTGAALIAGLEDRPAPFLPDYRIAFSLENLSRMAEIMAADLARLAESDAAKVEQNLDRVKGDLNALARLAAAEGGKATRTEVTDPTQTYPYLIQSLGLLRVEAETPGAVSLDQLGLHRLDDVVSLDADPWQNILSQYRENIEKIFTALRQP